MDTNTPDWEALAAPPPTSPSNGDTYHELPADVLAMVRDPNRPRAGSRGVTVGRIMDAIFDSSQVQREYWGAYKHKERLLADFEKDHGPGSARLALGKVSSEVRVGYGQLFGAYNLPGTFEPWWERQTERARAKAQLLHAAFLAFHEAEQGNMELYSSLHRVLSAEAGVEADSAQREEADHAVLSLLPADPSAPMTVADFLKASGLKERKGRDLLRQWVRDGKAVAVEAPGGAKLYHWAASN